MLKLSNGTDTDIKLTLNAKKDFFLRCKNPVNPILEVLSDPKSYIILKNF